MSKKVRAYFKDEIMDSPLFRLRKNQTNTYLFLELPIEFQDGQFYMDTIDGELPSAFNNFINGYSIQNYWLEGVKKSGIYRNERFAHAEAELKQRGKDNSGRGPESSILDVEGTVLADVLNLYYAIVADELLPVSLGSKTATQLLEELKELERHHEEEVKLRSGLEFVHRKQIDELKQERRGLLAQVDQLEERLAAVRKPWYKRLFDMIPSIDLFG